MSDLDKLMKKLKDKPIKKAKASPEEKEPKVEELDDDEDKEDAVPQGADPVEPIPASVEDPQHSLEGEVGVLQNNGIFRRELILVKKEQVDVLKVIAQTLLDIKTKLTGEDDGEKD